jgi:NOL1/NOP2/fmu family ribosome biogenesis protein|tara:strand:+ start:213 stop:665 length:453 start_codon:yes stop_codon:yes gene_type:complete
MQNIRILNNKEIKQILNLAEKQWEAKLTPDYVFLKTEKGKIYVVNKSISKLDLGKLRINTVGMYFSEAKENEMRLSIEGSQIVGPKAKKNVLELDEHEVKEWMQGNDLEKEGNFPGFFIIKHKDDFLGCGKWRNDKVLNYIGKARRVSVI